MARSDAYAWIDDELRSLGAESDVLAPRARSLALLWQEWQRDTREGELVKIVCVVGFKLAPGTRHWGNVEPAFDARVDPRPGNCTVDAAGTGR